MSYSFRLAFFAVLTCCIASIAQTVSQLRKVEPRDLFYETAILRSPAQHIPTLRYRVLQKQPDGGFAGVDPSSTVFQSGDQVRIHIEANQDGFLYIVQRGSSGQWGVLFPAATINNGNNRTTAFQAVEIPSAAGRGFMFDARAGRENVFLLYSCRSIPVDSLMASLNQPAPMKSRDLVFEKSEENAPG
ncbi:MAG: DUF4384 domain-containing protein, partial [Bryobacteraceae bacterium]